VVPSPVNHPDIPFDVKVYPGENFSCITLNGLGDNYIENVSFTDVHVTYAGGGSKELAAKRDIPQTAREYFTVWDPEPSGPPAYGMYARNVKGLTLQNVRFEYQNSDARPAVIFDNVHDASVVNLSVQGSPDAEATIRILNSNDIFLGSNRLLTPAKSFLQIEGKSAGITLDGGDVRKASKPVLFGAGVSANTVTQRI
jgi:hypothetical protein